MKKWSTINGGDYKGYYKNRFALRENNEIQKALVLMIKDGDTVMDWGAGDGLGKRLWEESPFTRDMSTWWKMIDDDDGFADTCTIGDAKDHLYDDVDAFVCLFAAEEIGVEEVAEKVKRTPRAVVVWFHLTPLSRASWYYMKWIRWFIAARRKNTKLKKMLEAQGNVRISKLAGQMGYWIAEKGT